MGLVEVRTCAEKHLEGTWLGTCSSSPLISLSLSPVAPEAWLALTTRSNKPW